METLNNKYFVTKYLKSIIWAILILYLSLANLNKNEAIKNLLFPFSDKIAHFIVYAIFTFLLMREAKINEKQIFPLIISIAYGILMEVLQYSLTDYRSLEFYDMLANSFGAISAWYLYKKFIFK